VLLLPDFVSHPPPKGRKSYIFRSDICGRAIKYLLPGGLGFYSFIYLAIAHQFLPNQGKSKRIRCSPFFVFD
jgi:hypothetical protein